MASEDTKPAPCCTGTLHTGTPTGTVETLHDLPCYTTRPPNDLPPKAIILIIPDAFGWELPNTRVLADAYAKRLQSLVLLPDVMDGHRLDWSLLDSLNIMTDKSKGVLSKITPTIKVLQSFPLFLYRTRPSLVLPRLTSFLTSLHNAPPSPFPPNQPPPIGAAGFCWGGKFVFSLCANPSPLPPNTTTDSNEPGIGVAGQPASDTKPELTPLIQCGFAAHPSNVTLPAEAAAVCMPLGICAGSEDVVFGAGEVEKVKKEFEGKGGKGEGLEVRVIEGAKHGFAVRGDEEKEEEAKFCLEAEDMAVEWFERFLLGKGEGR